MLRSEVSSGHGRFACHTRKAADIDLLINSISEGVEVPCTNCFTQEDCIFADVTQNGETVRQLEGSEKDLVGESFQSVSSCF